MATYYTKVMERVQSKGDAFVITEIDRLDRLIGKILFFTLIVIENSVFHVWNIEWEKIERKADSCSWFQFGK